jgi:hypothetical protein
MHSKQTAYVTSAGGQREPQKEQHQNTKTSDASPWQPSTGTPKQL